MIEKISILAVNESGESVELKSSELKIQSKLDFAIAESISEINHRQQAIACDETRTDEKFRFALCLDNFKKEMKENYADRTTNN